MLKMKQNPARHTSRLSLIDMLRRSALDRGSGDCMLVQQLTQSLQKMGKRVDRSVCLCTMLLVSHYSPTGPLSRVPSFLSNLSSHFSLSSILYAQFRFRSMSSPRSSMSRSSSNFSAFASFREFDASFLTVGSFAFFCSRIQPFLFALLEAACSLIDGM